MTRREFIWRKGILQFGLPVSFASMVWMQIVNGNSERSAVAAVVGMILGTIVGAALGGTVFGWLLWTVSGRRDSSR